MRSWAVRHNVTVRGAGSTPLIFAHGFGCDQTMWDAVAPAFEEDYSVILFDYAGHGGARAGSYARERYESMDGYVDDVLQICHEVGVRQGVFVGHSVSAMIGALATLASPGTFDRLVMI